MKNRILKQTLFFIFAWIQASVLFSQSTRPVAIAAATQLNIVYVGLENPIRIAVPGVAPAKISVMTTLGTITKASQSNYILTVPDTRGKKQEVTLKISYRFHGKNYCDSQIFRIMYVPRPETTFAGYTDGTIPVRRVLKADSVSVERSCFFFDGFSLRVTQFELVVALKDSVHHDTAFFAKSESSKLTSEMKILLNKLKIGDRIIITNIYAQPFGSQVPAGVIPRRVPDLVLTVGE